MSRDPVSAKQFRELVKFASAHNVEAFSFRDVSVSFRRPRPDVDVSPSLRTEIEAEMDSEEMQRRDKEIRRKQAEELMYLSAQ